ncbi:MAG: FAD-dependent oxidoreductase [Planctomycetota bacterium]
MQVDPRPRWQFRLRSLGDLAEMCSRLGVSVPTSDDLTVLAQPLTIGDLTIPNRLAIHPMEGCDGDAQGRPGPLTVRRYERFAAGGAGLLWMEATAIVPEGRANPRQLWLNDDSKAEFADLVQRIHTIAAARHGQAHRPILVAQLTHSGRYSKPHGKTAVMMAAHNPKRDAMLQLPRDGQIVTDDYLDSLADHYVSAARIAMEAGFDAVDVKACHGYLLNELLGAHTREGRHGRSFENRTRLILAIVDRIRAEVPQARITARLGVYDAMEYPYGWGVDKDDVNTPDLTEPKKLIGLLADRGVELINITVGNPYFLPHVNRPYNESTVGGYDSPEHPLTGVARIIELVGEIQQSFPDMAMIGTGYSWLRTLMPFVAAATVRDGRAKMVGCGRMAFAYPDFPADIFAKGAMNPEKVCVGCSGCTQMMRDGGMAGCVVRDSEIYGPLFRRGRLRDRDNLLRLAEGCRLCNEATCTQGCPAGVDISGFIGKFLEGDEHAAYDILRAANAFPLVCAELCPVEQQCQGHCLQEFIGDGALPIADIQRHLSVMAIEHGWAKLDIPEAPSGRRVAIVGAGPAGLACAAELLKAGHAVTVFDKSGWGGMVESVIPSGRVGPALGEEIAATFKDVPEDRLTLRKGVELSGGQNLDSLLGEGFDAAFIGLGLQQATGIDCDKPAGVTDALTFLQATKRGDDASAAGNRVAVIGGGNTAVDAAVAAVDAGARDVSLIYRRSFKEMPAWTAERDHAMAAGVNFLILTQPLGYESVNDQLTGLRVCPTALGDPDASGRRRPIAQKASAYLLEADVVIEAIGQRAPAELGDMLGGVDMPDGLVQVDDSLETTRSGVFAGGDIVRGPSTVVAAVADGMAAARTINKRLTAAGAHS